MDEGAGTTPFWPREVAVRGPITGVGGYPENTRNFIRGLAELGIGVLALASDGRPVSRAELPWLPHTAAARHHRIGVEFATLPVATWRRTPGLCVYSMFESTRMPANWLRPAQQLRAAIVPSAHCFGLWCDAGVPEDRIRIVRHGVDTRRFDGAATPWTAPPLPDGSPYASRRVRMLHVFGVGPRKNTTGLLTAWLQATRPSDDAALLLKALGDGPEVEQELAREIAAAERAAGKSLAAAAPIVWQRTPLAHDLMPGLYTACTHYVSASRGEGWDLGMTEAAASGLTLIAPAHTGYLAYLDPSIATMIPVRIEPATVHSKDILAGTYRNIDWYEPDRDALTAAIADAVAGRPQATGAQERIRQAYSVQHAAAELLDAVVSLWPEEVASAG